jgi:sulfonate transport system substrate-binding protein
MSESLGRHDVAQLLELIGGFKFDQGRLDCAPKPTCTSTFIANIQLKRRLTMTLMIRALVRRRFLGAAGLAAVGAWLPSAGWAQQTGSALPVRIGIQAQPSWLLYAARDLKLFERAGLAPTYVRLTTGAQAMAAMQSKSIDVACPGITPFAAGIAQGVDWKAIGIDANMPGAEGFVARKDTDIRKLEDLKGKTIAVARGSTSYYGLLAALKSKSIGKGDVKLLLMGPPEQLGAMRNGNVDAVAVWEPWIQRHVTEDGARLIGMEEEYGIYTAMGVYAVDRDYAQKNPEVLDRFLRAILMAHEYVEKNGPDVALTAVADAMGVKKELTQIMYKEAGAPNVPRWTDPSFSYSIAKGGPFRAQAQTMADFLFAEGIIDKKADLSQAFDDSYIRRVLQPK